MNPRCEGLTPRDEFNLNVPARGISAEVQGERFLHRRAQGLHYRSSNGDGNPRVVQDIVRERLGVLWSPGRGSRCNHMRQNERRREEIDCSRRGTKPTALGKSERCQQQGQAKGHG